MLELKTSKIALPILIIIVFVLVCVGIKYIFKPNIKRNQFLKEVTKIAEENKETTFKVSKIIKYSSAEAVDNSADQTLQDLSIHQYSDVAIYIDNITKELTEKNTIKELYLDNFKIDVGYNYGEPKLYYKNPLSISKFRMIEENEIKDKLSYTIINTNEENENSNYETPVFFADCSNPITIGFINKNIVNNYRVTKDNGVVSFDGRIFNNLQLDLKKLSPKISFTIHVKNNLDEKFVCNVSVDLQLETEEGSVKSGYIIQKNDNIKHYNFFKEVNI